MSADPIKVYDARWETGEFTDEQIRRMFDATFAYGRMLGVDTVTLARDARIGCGHVQEIALDAAMDAGLGVYLCPDPISTPQSYYLTLRTSQEHPQTMGLTITASHNPRQYVGVKFVVPVVQAIGQDCGPMGGLRKIRELYAGCASPHRPLGNATPARSAEQTQAYADAPGVLKHTLHLLNVTDEYIAFSMKQAGIDEGSLAGLGVVLDAFNGSAGPEMYRALTQAGCRVERMRLVPDGTFPTGSPNPTSEGKMNAAMELARKTGCQAVVGIDGDGDRIVFAAPQGLLTAGFAFVPILAACGIDPGAPRPAPVLYDPKVNPMALVEWAKLNARPVLFRNGHSQIKDYMTRIGAVAAAEESGHYYHRIRMGELTISAENSLVTVLLFLGAIKRRPGLMDELWAMQQRIFTTGEFNYQFDSDATRDRALDAVVAHFVKQGATTATANPDGIDLQGTCLNKGVVLDGRSARLESGWFSGYLRIATNEKAVVRSYFSAGDTSSGKRVETETRDVLEKAFGGKRVE